MSIDNDKPANKVKKTLDAKIEELAKKASKNFVTIYSENLKDEEGNSHISVDLRHGNRIFAEYSSGEHLNENIFSYVNGLCDYVPLINPLIIDFQIYSSMGSLKELIKNEFLAHYQFQVDGTKRKMRKNLLTSICLFSLGALFLAIYATVRYFLRNEPVLDAIIPEIVSIMAWVFVWAATEKVFFDRKEIAKEYSKNKQIKNAKIVFHETEE